MTPSLMLPKVKARLTILFAMLGENFRDRQRELRGNKLVRIESSEPGASLQATSDRRLSRAHHSDKHDGFACSIHQGNMRLKIDNEKIGIFVTIPLWLRPNLLRSWP